MVTHLEMAKELDGMERDVTSWEADFLNSILEKLNFGLALTEKQATRLSEMYERYLGDGSPDPEADVDL